MSAGGREEEEWGAACSVAGSVVAAPSAQAAVQVGKE